MSFKFDHSTVLSLFHLKSLVSSCKLDMKLDRFENFRNNLKSWLFKWRIDACHQES